MPQLITITSKRQITIPIMMFRDLGFREGQKITIAKEKNTLTLESTLAKVERLAGSVKIPPRFKKMPLEKIIQKAKKEYFRNKKS